MALIKMLDSMWVSKMHVSVTTLGFFAISIAYHQRPWVVKWYFGPYARDVRI